MNTRSSIKPIWGTLLAVATLSVIFPLAAAGDIADPPGRVARIRYVQGSVSFEPAGESDWVPAVTNRPMTIGDQVWADASSRAEIQIGSAIIRMDQNTGFSFLNLDDRTVQIQLTDGTIEFRVHRLGRNEVFEVDTPNQAFSVTQPGLYRVQAGSDGTSSMVMVRQGRGQVTGGGNTYDLYSGQGGTFYGTDSLDGQLLSAADPDEFDNWGDSRDRQYDGSRSARYVSQDVVGYEDLDGNGTWSTDPTYGNVWTPTSVDSGWAPYRNGHWVWVAPWGWTWVDDAPWGYAPFHYGRWVSLRGRWGWVPGPVNVEPVYAPALVAFVGGRNFGVSISGSGSGFGGENVGWFPLGPREVYVPSYGASRAYIERVNTSNTPVNATTITNVYNNQVTNNTTITNVTYVNKTVPGAVTAVPQAAFRSSAPVARAAVPVNEKQITAVPVVARAVVAPTRESVLGTSSPGATRMARPPEAVVNRPVVAKTTPPPPPVPFAKQQQELAKYPGQPLAAPEVQALRPATVAAAHPQVKQAPPARPAALNANRPANQPMVGNAKQPADAPPSQQTNRPGNTPVANAPNNQPPVRGDRPPSAQQQQAAQQQATQQQQVEKARQQQAEQQAAEKARQQQAAQQQTAQQQAAEKARQQQAAQQQAAQQQAAEKARQQQAAQQQTAQQQAAEKARQQQAAQQQTAQQQAAEKVRQQQQQDAEQQAQHRPPSAQASPSQQAAQQQQQAERARQQQALQQQAAQQQQAQRERQQEVNPQAVQHRPPAAQPPPQAPAQPVQSQQATPNRPLTPAEKAQEEQKKREEKPPPPEQ